MKNSNKNFVASALPHTRKAQFFDILKHRYGLLILCGIFAFLGFAPLLFAYGTTVYISNASVFLEIVKSYSNDAGQQAYLYFWTVNVSYAIMIPLFTIGFVILVGVLRVFRLLGWGEGVFFFHDFWKGIKANFKTGILLSLILGTYIFITKFIGGALTLYADANLGTGVEIFFKGALFLLVVPLVIVSLLLTTYFDQKFSVAVSNAFRLYANKVFPFLGCSIVLATIYLFPFIGNYYLILLSVALTMVFLFPIYLLTCNEIALASFDELIDIPGVKLKGLYDPKMYVEEENL